MKKWWEWVKQHPKLALTGSIIVGVIGSGVHNSNAPVGTILILLSVIGIFLSVRAFRLRKEKGGELTEQAEVQSEKNNPVLTDVSVVFTGPSDEELRKQMKQTYEENKEKIQAQRKAAKEAFNTPEGRDNKWREYGELSRKHIQDKNYGLYRNVRYNMAMFVKKENRPLNTLNLLTEVIFWDLTGCGNNFEYSSFLSITMGFLFPYEKSTMTLAPGVIREVGVCQKVLDFSDEQLKEQIFEHLQNMTAPVKFFTNSEICDIFFWERDQNTAKLKNVYVSAKKRFDPKHPNAIM